MTEQNQITDTFGRTHDYLRISLTERCNLRCVYCMPEDGIKLRDKSHFMTKNELVSIAKTFVKLGVKKIRLTGGEPLVRKDAKEIIIALGKLPVELAITTNAILVDQFIAVFKEAGLKSVNVSIDSLIEERFNSISRRIEFQKVKKNIDLLIAEGFHVKLNVVVIRNVNEDEIADFVSLAEHQNVHIRFIEFMPFDGNKWEWDKKVSYKEILSAVESEFGNAAIVKIKDQKNDTTKCFQIQNFKGTFGIISSVTNPFCDTCNRIRLTADGKVKNCLFSQDETDILTSFRKEEDIEQLIRAAILQKKKERGGHRNFDDDFVEDMKNRSMITIGG